MTQLSSHVRAALFMPWMRPSSVAHTTVFPHLRPEEFGRFAALLQSDEGFPQTYGRWLSRTAPSEGREAAHVVDIGFDEFVSYCERLESPPRLLMLMACASAKSARVAEPERH